MAEPALDQLVQTLLEGTRAGTVNWQEATGALAGQIALTVRDPHGLAISELASATPGDALRGGASSAAARLHDLFDAVATRHTGNNTALQKLIAEFRQPV
jgi:hypothetical protein